MSYTGIGADPNAIAPCEKYDHIVFLKNVVRNPNIQIGDFTYYSDLVNDPRDFEKNNVLYVDDLCQDRLIIGKYCSIASGTKFLMNASNHKIDAFTVYPFKIFNVKGWGDGSRSIDDITYKGDTVVGNDVWLGYQATVLPGARIGNGAIIGANALVTGTIPPYSIAAGNPAKVKKMRFDDKVIETLERIRWWDWEPEKVASSVSILTGGNAEELEKLL
ncbi:MAG: CatB-related O-acetyltransferase [Spirochaetes bacterium]|nr:CatB-related O-acetyltransferase [Spirochaetota bacterium]